MLACGQQVLGDDSRLLVGGLQLLAVATLMLAGDSLMLVCGQQMLADDSRLLVGGSQLLADYPPMLADG